MLRIEEVTDAGRLAALREPWQKLVERAPNSDMFHTYEWVTSWLGCFWMHRPIAFLFIWNDDELIGLAPLLHDEGAEVSCRDSLSLPVNAHARRQDILCAGNAPAVLDAILAHAERTGRRVKLTLRQSRADSPMASALPVIARSRHLATMQLPARTSPIVRIDATWDEYLATRSTQVQRELKRKLRKIERDWHAEWTIASTVEACERAMDDVWRIERKSWKENEGTSLTSEREAIRLYQEFAPRFAAAGWLRVYVLHLNGEPVAHILGAEFHREYYALKTSYDREYRQASPGQALFFYALRDAFQRKLTAFDFLGDESRWKNELSNAERVHVNVCAHSRLNPACVWHTLLETQLKPFAKEHAPGLIALRHRLSPASRPAPVVVPETEPPPETEAPLRKTA